MDDYINDLIPTESLIAENYKIVIKKVDTLYSSELIVPDKTLIGILLKHKGSKRLYSEKALDPIKSKYLTAFACSISLIVSSELLKNKGVFFYENKVRDTLYFSCGDNVLVEDQLSAQISATSMLLPPTLFFRVMAELAGSEKKAIPDVAAKTEVPDFLLEKYLIRIRNLNDKNREERKNNNTEEDNDEDEDESEKKE